MTSRRTNGLLATAFLVVTVVVWWCIWHVLTVPHNPLLAVVILCSEMLAPPLGLWAAFVALGEGRHFREPGIFRRVSFQAVVLVLTVTFLAGFIFYFGNRQFGAWDFNVIVDTGWREWLGQRPYVDFLTPNPPGFNLGVLYAYRLFGVSWNATLELTGLFVAVTFLWLFALLRASGVNPAVAWLAAFTAESVTFLSTDFWWYNNVTKISAVVFLLSVYLCLKLRRVPLIAWFSYACSLALLALQKPNIAGVLIVGAVPLLLLGLPAQRGRVVLYTLVGAALAVALLWVNHVSLGAMLSAYRAAAKERGWKAVPLAEVPWPQVVQFCMDPILCGLPLLLVLKPMARSWRARDWPGLARCALFLLPIPACALGFRTDADFKEMDAILLLPATVILLFTTPIASIQLKRKQQAQSYIIAVQLALIVTTLLLGRYRERVRAIGFARFYESTNNHLPVGDTYFSSLTATPRMHEVQREVHEVAQGAKAPVFFGPRLEFEYAALHLTPPLHWPVYYQAGTSFLKSDTPRLEAMWRQAHYSKMIFLGDDRTYMTPGMLQTLKDDYVQVPGYAELQVFVPRSVAP